MNEWEMTEEEILEATQLGHVEGVESEDFGYLSGRVQVAKAAQKKLLLWGDGECENPQHSGDRDRFNWQLNRSRFNCQECWLEMLYWFDL